MTKSNELRTIKKLTAMFQAYSKDPKDTSTKHHKLFYHALGTDQSNDPIVAEFSDQPDYYMYISAKLTPY